LHFCSGWTGNSEHERLDLSKVLIFDRQIERKTVPDIAVAVFSVSPKSAPQSRRQPNIIQTIFPVERVDTGISTYEISNNIGMPLQQVTRDMFEVCVDKRISPASAAAAA
jgi:hypothetical protein